MIVSADERAAIEAMRAFILGTRDVMPRTYLEGILRLLDCHAPPYLDRPTPTPTQVEAAGRALLAARSRVARSGRKSGHPARNK